MFKPQALNAYILQLFGNSLTCSASLCGSNRCNAQVYRYEIQMALLKLQDWKIPWSSALSVK